MSGEYLYSVARPMPAAGTRGTSPDNPVTDWRDARGGMRPSRAPRPPAPGSLILPILPGALCKGQDPAVWFPRPSGSMEEAKTVCQACPARLRCLQWAVRANERRGLGRHQPRRTRPHPRCRQGAGPVSAAPGTERTRAPANTAVPPVPARRRKEADPVPRVMAGSLTRAGSATVGGDDLTGLVCWSRGFLR
jgi:WhiB family redox-sensing transcriptional regulator